MQSISNQLAQASSGADRMVTLRDLEISKQKSAAVMDAVAKVVQLDHLRELVSSQNKYKRSAEMKVLLPLLSGLQRAANIADKTLQMLETQIERELLEGAHCDLERLAALQSAYSLAIDDLSKTVTTTQKTIKLERESGGREYERIGKALSVSYLANLDNPNSGNSPTGPMGHITGGGAVQGLPAPETPPAPDPGTVEELDENGQPRKAKRKLTPQQMKNVILNGVTESAASHVEAVQNPGEVIDDTGENAPVEFGYTDAPYETQIQLIVPSYPIFHLNNLGDQFGFGATRPVGQEQPDPEDCPAPRHPPTMMESQAASAAVAAEPARDPWAQENEFGNPEMLNLDEQ